MSEARMEAGNDFVVEKAREMLWEGAFEDEITERILEGEYDSVILDRLKALLMVVDGEDNKQD